MRKEQEAIIESLVYVEEQMQDKRLANELKQKYVNYLEREYPNEDTFSMVKKYKKSLKKKLKKEFTIMKQL